jgi:hypothetical protein
MLELREFNLQLPFPRPGALGEDIEDQRGAIQDFAFKDLFQVAALSRRKFVIENDGVDIVLATGDGELIGLAFTNESSRDGRFQLLPSIAHDVGSGRAGQLAQFVERFLQIQRLPRFKFQADEKDSFGFFGGRFDQCFQILGMRPVV